MPDVRLPQEDGRSRLNYDIPTRIDAMVAEYANLPLPTLGELDWLDYLRLRRDAFIRLLSRSEEGVEALNEAWLLEQTEPDRDALRSVFGADILRM